MTGSNLIATSPDSQDRLTRLPPEILHYTIDFLFASHWPDMMEVETGRVWGVPHIAPHDLDRLAATCRFLRAEVMQWSLHFLTQHSKITRYRPLKTPELQGKRNLLRGRSGVLTWAQKNCVFCGKKSTRSAVFMNGLRCCIHCDYKHWSGRITRSEAKRRYLLKDHHLLPSKYPPPPQSMQTSSRDAGLRDIPYGVCFVAGAQATMFLRHDVEAVAERVHGDLDTFFAKREAARKKRNHTAEGD